MGGDGEIPGSEQVRAGAPAWRDLMATRRISLRATFWGGSTPATSAPNSGPSRGASRPQKPLVPRIPPPRHREEESPSPNAVDSPDTEAAIKRPDRDFLSPIGRRCTRLCEPESDNRTFPDSLPRTERKAEIPGATKRCRTRCATLLLNPAESNSETASDHGFMVVSVGFELMDSDVSGMCGDVETCVHADFEVSAMCELVEWQRGHSHGFSRSAGRSSSP
ncbi:hypothetical protein HDC37_001452 [Microbacterium sp. AK009]|nr:hypothetical protein [Microbacterium sp. AK009]